MRNLSIFMFLAGVILSVVPWGVSHAQDAAVPAAAPTAAPEIAGPPVPLELIGTSVNPTEIGPIVFTYWERTAIYDARRARGLVRTPTDEELMKDLRTAAPLEKVKPPPEQREIRLNGIVYVHAGDWTIWLNEQRVTPHAIPKEIMDLKVNREYVEMKWYDEYSNRIYPLRLRPHERFNMDTRIFLPG
ncbi:MAG: hypothetical protein IT558_00920 [Alphaproteobacteria bacterium]|nr:hypothetical protein [Alphaproteobacteria bacterium]